MKEDIEMKPSAKRPTRNCDAVTVLAGGLDSGTLRCTSSSIGLFTVNGSRMRLCVHCEEVMTVLFPNGVLCVSRFCDACWSEPCTCNPRLQVAKGERT